jgi:CspA family cold shock protein
MTISKNKNNNKNDNLVERVAAAVKWYSPLKGYGFLTRIDTSEDIMIHFSNLDKIGCVYIKPGDRVLCDIALGRFGLQVIRVIQVVPDSSGIRSFTKAPLPPLDSGSLHEAEGMVKWYNPTKEYGFIKLNGDDEREVFLHSSVVHAAGYKTLLPGLRVFVKFFQSERGLMAQLLKVIYEEEEKIKA